MITDRCFGKFKFILYHPVSGGNLPLIVVLYGSGGMTRQEGV